MHGQQREMEREREREKKKKTHTPTLARTGFGKLYDQQVKLNLYLFDVCVCSRFNSLSCLFPSTAGKILKVARPLFSGCALRTRVEQRKKKTMFI
jgi:hypothetical protein